MLTHKVGARDLLLIDLSGLHLQAETYRAEIQDLLDEELPLGYGYPQ